MVSSGDYASYMLRLRKVRNDTQATWVASVQSTATGEQRSFPSIEALAIFLLSQYTIRPPADDPPCDAETGFASGCE